MLALQDKALRGASRDIRVHVHGQIENLGVFGKIPLQETKKMQSTLLLIKRHGAF
jgi:hypothetical protein